MDNMQYSGMQGPQPMPQGVPAPGNPMVGGPVQPGGIASQGAQVISQPIKKDVGGLVKTIVIIVLAMVAVTFVGLFIWMHIRFDEVQMDVNGQIEVAVAEAVDKQAMKDEQEFLQREKYPFRTFKGPADYGELTFEYPKTWSVYIEAAATKGGDFKAFLNPIEVNTVDDETIMALRVSILNESFDKVTEDYQKKMERRDAGLTMESKTYNGVTGNLYTGKIPDTEFQGLIFIFKIRDKTAILQTDAREVFQGDYDTLLNSVRFNA